MRLFKPVPAMLQDSPLRQSFPGNELRRLHQLGTASEVRPGKQIIAEGSPGREVFVVVDGEFDVEGPDFCGSIRGGEIMGELALLTGNRRNASVSSATAAVVYQVDPQDFAQLLDGAPRLREHVVQSAAERLSPEPGPDRAIRSWHLRRSVAQLAS